MTYHFDRVEVIETGDVPSLVALCFCGGCGREYQETVRSFLDICSRKGLFLCLDCNEEANESSGILAVVIGVE